MKKVRYIFLLGLFMLFVPRVYALTYDIKTVNNVSVKVGSKIDINVAIDNISDTVDGVSVCSMNILFDNNIKLDSSISTLNSWSMTKGTIYLFDTGAPVMNQSDIFKMPVVVNGEGAIYLNNIVCSDGVEEIEVSNKKINFSIEKEIIKEEENKTDNNEQNDNQPSNTKPNQNKPSQNKPNNNEITNNKPTDNESSDNKQEEIVVNCNLSNIELSEGTIDFDPNVTEYEVTITNFDNFKVYPKLDDDTAELFIDRNVTENGGNIVITVNGNNGESKVYTIYTVVEKSNNEAEKETKNNNYVPTFIVIIVALVIINLVRIIIKVKKNREQN